MLTDSSDGLASALEQLTLQLCLFYPGTLECVVSMGVTGVQLLAAGELSGTGTLFITIPSSKAKPSLWKGQSCRKGQTRKADLSRAEWWVGWQALLICLQVMCCDYGGSLCWA